MPETKDGFNKFQWSGQYGGSMVVIRTNDEEEFDTLVEKYEALVAGKITPDMSTADAKIKNFTKDIEAGENLCPEHNVPMLQGFSAKKNKSYSYHDFQGKRCFGRGYMPPRV